MTLSSERSAAYGVIALVIILLLAAVWPQTSSALTPAQAAAPILIVATPTPNPAWTPRPAPAPRDAPPMPPTEPHALAIDSAPAGGADQAPATVAEPPSQLVYEGDGSVTLPGVDTTWQAPPEPTVMPEPTAPAAEPRGGCAARGPAAERLSKCKR